MTKKRRTKNTARPGDTLPAVRPPPETSRKGLLVICGLLFALVWLVFGQTLGHDFVNYDDPEYVVENPNINRGLSVTRIAHVFTEVHARNWHPLTTLSHMLDCQLFGLNPRGHHLTNVLLHSLNAMLLFLLLNQMTAATWRSAFVAAVFAIHPLRVESVAWIAERKDVLSGLFFLLTVAAYRAYARAPSGRRYLLVCVALAAGLLAKPMLVTLPFLFLLLDHWPLRRSVSRWLVLEKIPLMALAAIASLVTFLIQRTGGVQSDDLPLLWRIANALVACVTYLRQTFWPAALAPFYPHPLDQFHASEIIFALFFLGAISTCAILWRSRRPYLFTGWFWYLGMLVPVVGLVQVGAQGWADRYTYLPQIGILIALTWSAADLSRHWRFRREILGVAAAVMIANLSWAAWIQTKNWRDSRTLWTHTLAVTRANHVAHNNLGKLLQKDGQIEAALAQYEEALALRSRARAWRHDYLLALYHNNVGSALFAKGELPQAAEHFAAAIRLQPDYALAHLNLGTAFLEMRQVARALEQFKKAIALQPADAEGYINLATALLQNGQEEEAVVQYENALRLAPDALTPLSNLAWLFATSSNPTLRRAPDALRLARHALEVAGPDDSFTLHKLAAAQAANEMFDEAAATAQRALQLAIEQGNAPLAAELRRNLARYEAHRPLTEKPR